MMNAANERNERKGGKEHSFLKTLLLLKFPDLSPSHFCQASFRCPETSSTFTFNWHFSDRNVTDLFD